MAEESCARVLVPDEEDIVRGVFDEAYDGKEIHPSCFGKDGNVSVNRLSIIPLSQQSAVLRRENPLRNLKLLLDLNVRTLRAEGLAYKAGKKAKPFALTVEAKETPSNPSHAEIIEPFTRGFASQLVRIAGKHFPSLEEGETASADLGQLGAERPQEHSETEGATFFADTVPASEPARGCLSLLPCSDFLRRLRDRFRGSNE